MEGRGLSCKGRILLQRQDRRHPRQHEMLACRGYSPTTETVPTDQQLVIDKCLSVLSVGGLGTPVPQHIRYVGKFLPHSPNLSPALPPSFKTGFSDISREGFFSSPISPKAGKLPFLATGLSMFALQANSYCTCGNFVRPY